MMIEDALFYATFTVIIGIFIYFVVELKQYDDLVAAQIATCDAIGSIAVIDLKGDLYCVKPDKGE